MRDMFLISLSHLLIACHLLWLPFDALLGTLAAKKKQENMKKSLDKRNIKHTSLNQMSPLPREWILWVLEHIICVFEINLQKCGSNSLERLHGQ